MKKHSKVGNRKGMPAYRTPSDFASREGYAMIPTPCTTEISTNTTVVAHSKMK